METLKPSFLFTKWSYHNRKIETWSFFLYSSIPKYKPYSFKENSKISHIALHHLSGILFWDLISFPYLIQTTLFSHITWPWVIPPKPGVLFPPGAFFNFCAKNYIWLIFRNTWSTLYIWNSPNSFYLRHIFQMLLSKLILKMWINVVDLMEPLDNLRELIWTRSRSKTWRMNLISRSKYEVV
jgi:hypothetical protein